MNKVVIITGASSGIGKEIAICVAKLGYKVYGLARRIDIMEELKQYGITPLKVDITISSQIQQAIQQILEENSQIDILINNAGYGYYDALEMGDIEKAKQMFDVNVFGLIEMTKAVLPSMRSQYFGKIINISSVVGKVAFPYMGWYSASKHAVEGLSDALRLEVASFGISVSIIEPGRIKSEFGKVAFEHSDMTVDSAYKKQKLAFQEMIDNNPIPADTPSSIAKSVLEIINSPHPKTRYVPNLDGKIATFCKRFLGDWAIDWGIKRILKK